MKNQKTVSITQAENGFVVNTTETKPIVCNSNLHAGYPQITYENKQFVFKDLDEVSTFLKEFYYGT